MNLSVKKILIIAGMALVFLVLPLTVILTIHQRDIRSKAAGFANTVAVNGGNYFLLGANYPWVSYGNDFGTNGFGDFGVHKGGVYPAQFADMKAKGVHVARWWVFGDGRAGIIFDSTGKPVGLDPSVITNLDAAVALAKSNNIYLNLVFLDFSFLFNQSSLGSGVVSGGHSDVLTDTTKTTALMNNVVTPIMNRYSNEPYILSWEIMNEPEWVINNLPQPAINSRAVPVTMQQFWNFGSQFSSLVHTKTRSLVTVGSASLKWNKVWTNAFATKKGLPALNLDYYQTHYYSWMDPYTINNDSDLGTTALSPMTQNANSLLLDKPIVVGESDDRAGSCSGNCENKVFNNGYAGYWPWSYWGGDGLTVNWPVLKTWEGANASLVQIPPANSIVTPKLGDINKDGQVNSSDLAILLSTWGSTTDLRADLNGDFKVTSADLAILLSRWGS